MLYKSRAGLIYCYDSEKTGFSEPIFGNNMHFYERCFRGSASAPQLVEFRENGTVALAGYNTSLFSSRPVQPREVVRDRSLPVQMAIAYLMGFSVVLFRCGLSQQSLTKKVCRRIYGLASLTLIQRLWPPVMDLLHVC